MATESFDVVIVGGGIHGAGVAQAAAAAGHSVRLLEQSALAAGTSSRSSKLIHGGLRYLETFQLSLVRECLHERSLLLKLAPDLVKLKPFYIPLYAETQRRPWQLRSGLSLYSLLGGLGRETRFSTIDKSEWSQLDGLDCSKLQQLFRYYDAQTDDAALTRAVVRSAQQLGAEVVVPATFNCAELSSTGSIIHYTTPAGEQRCEAKVLVNAAGPWVNRVLERISPPVTKVGIDLVQGSHIIINEKVEHGLYYLEAPQDQRAIFVMPWGEKMLVGTTETTFHGDPAKVTPLDSEIDYLWKTLGHYFPRFRGKPHDQISSTFAGLRVLPSAHGGHFSRPRETILHVNNHTKPTIITIYGGKLTAYRATAEKLMKKLKPSLPRRTAVADTRKLALKPD